MSKLDKSDFLDRYAEVIDSSKVSSPEKVQEIAYSEVLGENQTPQENGVETEESDSSIQNIRIFIRSALEENYPLDWISGGGLNTILERGKTSSSENHEDYIDEKLPSKVRQLEVEEKINWECHGDDLGEEDKERCIEAVLLNAFAKNGEEFDIKKITITSLIRSDGELSYEYKIRYSVFSEGENTFEVLGSSDVGPFEKNISGDADENIEKSPEAAFNEIPKVQEANLLYTSLDMHQFQLVMDSSILRFESDFKSFSNEDRKKIFASIVATATYTNLVENMENIVGVDLVKNLTLNGKLAVEYILHLADGTEITGKLRF